MTQTDKVHVTIVGCGKMGTALIQGWLKANLLSRADIIDPEGNQENKNLMFIHSKS